MTAEELVQTQRRLGVSQRELAARLGVSPRQVAYFLSGQKPIPAAVAERVRNLGTRRENTNVSLADATDAQLIAELAGRLGRITHLTDLVRTAFPQVVAQPGPDSQALIERLAREFDLRPVIGHGSVTRPSGDADTTTARSG
ncbi:helix-turn-helix domain-containing protein [Nakamurella leprariae]|uniref:Helix-turn-helix domain-containing protein n=1 Tax=Nakamurella leprariae TaxID=2803911 RepID=A0A938YAW2_9ACTN|nr:helix-turn-helix domain-containing protein [Nakamurella leprariae]